jgi:hypothetical protein
MPRSLFAEWQNSVEVRASVGWIRPWGTFATCRKHSKLSRLAVLADSCLQLAVRLTKMQVYVACYCWRTRTFTRRRGRKTRVVLLFHQQKGVG